MDCIPLISYTSQLLPANHVLEQSQVNFASPGVPSTFFSGGYCFLYTAENVTVIRARLVSGVNHTAPTRLPGEHASLHHVGSIPLHHVGSIQFSLGVNHIAPRACQTSMRVHHVCSVQFSLGVNHTAPPACQTDMRLYTTSAQVSLVQALIISPQPAWPTGKHLFFYFTP